MILLPLCLCRLIVRDIGSNNDYYKLRACWTSISTDTSNRLPDARTTSWFKYTCNCEWLTYIDRERLAQLLDLILIWNLIIQCSWHITAMDKMKVVCQIIWPNKVLAQLVIHWFVCAGETSNGLKALEQHFSTQLVAICLVVRKNRSGRLDGWAFFDKVIEILLLNFDSGMAFQ